MEEGKNKNAQGSKRETVEAIKVFYKKILFITFILVSAFFLCGAGFYYIKGDDFKTTSETKQTYSTAVNNQGQVTYTKKEEDGTIVKLTPAEMAEEYKDVLKQYISEDDEEYVEVMQYLMGAETVTTMPYFDTVSEGELNGRIKFYRYTDSEDEVNGQDVTEENRLKFKPLEEFNAKLEAYKTNASANRDIFNYFTMDEEGTVLVAYGSEEYRKIITGVDRGAKDKDLTPESVKESSTFEVEYSGNYNTGFSASHFTIDTKPIDYRSLVEQYTMPSTLLYAFLIQTENIEFVKALANLAYETEIAIGIYDNKYDSETSELYTYKKLFKMKVETDLEYLDMLVSITDSQPSIVLKETDLSSSPYQYIPISCKVETADNGQIKHIKTFKKEGQNTWTLTPSKMFIGGTNNNNQITSLGEGETYKTKYTKTINSMSTPTVGVLLADTWIAKWEATYTKETPPIPDNAEGPTEKEDKEITVYTFDKVLNAFDQNLGSNISNKLTEHAEAMRADAINKIITTAESISPSIFEVEVDSVKFSDSEKREVFKKHVLECNDGRAWSQDCGYERDCWDYITHYYPWIVKNQNIETVMSSVENIDTFIGYVNSGPLTSTTVKQHFNTEWNNYKKQKTQASEQVANNQEKARKDEFERQVKRNGAIDYYQTFSGSKHYVDTTYTYSSSGSSSRYIKSEEIQRTEDGKKFSEVFNRDEFHSVREIFDEIELWFWEYIRIDQDTEKIGDILRYLLNIATNPEYLNTLTDEEKEEIEELFSAFKPAELITINKLYGNNIETKIWFALRGQGYSPIAVAGVMGNLYQESNIRTNNVQDKLETKIGHTDETYTKAVNNGLYLQSATDEVYTEEKFKNDEVGYGLAQWTFPSRKEGLYAFARHRGVSIDDEDMQIEYLIGEMKKSGGAEGFAKCAFMEDKNKVNTVDKWLNASDPEEAADVFCWIFEGPNEDKADLSEREKWARYYYDKYKDAENGGIFVKNTSSDKKIIGTFTSSITGRTFTIFNQLKIDGWRRGCNRAAQISVCSGYWNGTSDELIEECRKAPNKIAPGYHALYSACGLTYTVKASQLSSPYTFDSNTIKEQIQNGGYVVLYVRGKDHGADGVSKINPDRDWANSAHWVAILGYRDMPNEAGGIGEIFVSDSANGHTGWHPVNEFDKITCNVFFVNEK